MTDSVVFATGARGSGKSSWLKQYARGFGRVLVFSPLESTNRYADYLGVDPSPTLDSFVAPAFAGRAVWAPPRRANSAMFDMWCKIVWTVGDCLALVDELAHVSRPGKAVGWWGDLVMFGRHRRVCVAAAAQRPTEVDSTIRGNATRIAVFRLSKRSDRQLMADELDIDIERVRSLRSLQFLDYDVLTGAVHPGRVVFR